MTELLMPGDKLATSEEYIPGPGTFERNGMIYAAVIGVKDFDEREKIARVKGQVQPRELRPGDTVLGEVSNVTNSVAMVSVSCIEAGGCMAGRNETGVIHVSKVKQGFTEDARREFRIGDLVRARVEQVTPSLQLSTVDEEFGVLKARCMKCRAFLANRDGTLYCRTCEKEESRKLAGDFHRFTAYY